MMNCDFVIRLPLSGEIGCRVCSKKMWERIQGNERDETIQRDMFASKEFIVSGHIDSKFEIYAFIREYKRALNAFRKDKMDMMMIPEGIPEAEEEHVECKLMIYSMLEKMVYDYIGINYVEQSEMLITDWWLISADAVKFSIIKGRGNEGKKDLNSCWYTMHNKVDRSSFI